ncbi:MAG: type II toxin-antitoxin system Phd/YefM family antitoxin [Magnetococcales bacterium]|nr:type II toxin-antitoxin system Phd/YefM family antitoxin [Magnetococcales bacterium]
MIHYNLHDAKTHLSRLVNRAISGEEVVIARGNKPLVRLVPLTPPPKGRVFGSLKTSGQVDDSFFDPLPEEESKAWNGE